MSEVIQQDLFDVKEREKEIEGLIPKKEWKNELKNKPIQEWKCS